MYWAVKNGPVSLFDLAITTSSQCAFLDLWTLCKGSHCSSSQLSLLGFTCVLALLGCLLSLQVCVSLHCLCVFFPTRYRVFAVRVHLVSFGQIIG